MNEQGSSPGSTTEEDTDKEYDIPSSLHKRTYVASLNHKSVNFGFNAKFIRFHMLYCHSFISHALINYTYYCYYISPMLSANPPGTPSLENSERVTDPSTTFDEI